MRAALVLSGPAGVPEARELVAAARSVPSTIECIWRFGSELPALELLPAGRLSYIPVDGPLVADRYLPALADLYDRFRPEVVLFPGGLWGDELAARFGCSIAASTAIGVHRIASRGNGRIQIARAVYGAHIEAEFSYDTPPFVFSVPRGSFTVDAVWGNPAVSRETISLAGAEWWRNHVETASEGERNLDAYDFVIVGGRGIGSRSNMERLLRLADRLGAAVGGSRPAVLNGWLPPERLVGLSGTTISPKLCIVLGASGCMPLVRGIETSETIVAVNSDPEAPIFDYCDVGIVDDCMTMVGELEKLAADPSPLR